MPDSQTTKTWKPDKWKPSKNLSLSILKPVSLPPGLWLDLSSLHWNWKVKVKVAQSCLTLCDPTDYTVHGILQARIMEWVAFSFSRGSSCHVSVCSSVLSRHNRDLEWRTLKPPRHVTALRSWIDRVIALRSRMDHVIALRQISVTAQCYGSILFRR